MWFFQVRRVSFALPEKDNSCEESQEKSSETISAASQLKTASSPFTAVKQVIYYKQRPNFLRTDSSNSSSSNLYFTDKNTFQVLHKYKNSIKESYPRMRRENL